MSDEKLLRLSMLVGEQGIARLRRAHVVVCGLGAVGGYALEALVRAGVGRLRVVDFDEIRPTNFNRQLLALDSTVGMAKVEAARRRALDIRPDCVVETVRTFVHVETMDAVLEGPPDLAIDAIDSLRPKVELIAAAVRRGIPLVSSMGAALRTDPTRIRVGPLAASSRCPMARRVRQRLKRLGVPLGFPCVWSDEPTADLPEAALGEAEGDTEEIYRRGRRRRALGSLPTLTGIFGLFAANEALRIILGDSFPTGDPAAEPLAPSGGT
jgi:tRNA A37 threonylcarbamoyladenosine dehydratase